MTDWTEGIVFIFLIVKVVSQLWGVYVGDHSAEVHSEALETEGEVRKHQAEHNISG